jgi:hypothetical protein
MAARDIETDDNPERFKERLAKVVNHKPIPEKDRMNSVVSGSRSRTSRALRKSVIKTDRLRLG